MTKTLPQAYETLYTTSLAPIAPRLQQVVGDHLKGLPHIDRITARAKEPRSFLTKAAKRLPDGSPKYVDPMNQIQDLLGVRVVVFYPQDVASVGTETHRYFRLIEERKVVPDSEWEFGYFGQHFVCVLPPEAVPAEVRGDNAPPFFELQVKTLFQHAWAEAGHDLGYKPIEELSGDQKRRLAFTAAQAWGADRSFGELYVELNQGS